MLPHTLALATECNICAMHLFEWPQKMPRAGFNYCLPDSYCTSGRIALTHENFSNSAWVRAGGDTSFSRVFVLFFLLHLHVLFCAQIPCLSQGEFSRPQKARALLSEIKIKSVKSSEASSILTSWIHYPLCEIKHLLWTPTRFFCLLSPTNSKRIVNSLDLTLRRRLIKENRTRQLVPCWWSFNLSYQNSQGTRGSA